MKDILKKHWKWIALAIIIIVVVAIYLKRRRKESNYGGCSSGCCDCGPGGMFGEGWNREKFESALRNRMIIDLRNMRPDGSVEIGSEEYKKGRQIAINRMERAREELRDVMNMPGVYGMGTVNNLTKESASEFIEIAVKDDATRKKVSDWIDKKQKALNLIGGQQQGLHYYEYPVKVVIREQSVAQQ